jgi:hypothetical protein
VEQAGRTAAAAVVGGEAVAQVGREQTAQLAPAPTLKIKTKYKMPIKNL